MVWKQPKKTTPLSVHPLPCVAFHPAVMDRQNVFPSEMGVVSILDWTHFSLLRADEWLCHLNQITQMIALQFPQQPLLFSNSLSLFSQSFSLSFCLSVFLLATPFSPLLFLYSRFLVSFPLPSPPLWVPRHTDSRQLYPSSFPSLLPSPQLLLPHVPFLSPSIGEPGWCVCVYVCVYVCWTWKGCAFVCAYRCEGVSVCAQI